MFLLCLRVEHTNLIISQKILNTIVNKKKLNYSIFKRYKQQKIMVSNLYVSLRYFFN